MVFIQYCDNGQDDSCYVQYGSIRTVKTVIRKRKLPLSSHQLEGDQNHRYHPNKISP